LLVQDEELEECDLNTNLEPVAAPYVTLEDIDFWRHWDYFLAKYVYPLQYTIYDGFEAFVRSTKSRFTLQVSSAKFTCHRVMATCHRVMANDLFTVSFAFIFLIHVHRFF